jgi:hypothetical protein
MPKMCEYNDDGNMAVGGGASSSGGMRIMEKEYMS